MPPIFTSDKYIYSLVVYLDVLGFKSFVNDLEDEVGSIERLNGFFNELRVLELYLDPRFQSRQGLLFPKILDWRLISDSVFLIDYYSSHISEEFDESKALPTHIGNISTQIAPLYFKLLSKGFCVEGGFSIGKVFCEGTHLLGEGVNSAVSLVDNRGCGELRLPRILVHQGVVDRMKEVGVWDDFKWFSKVDQRDGKLVFNVFQAFKLHIEHMDYEYDLVSTHEIILNNVATLEGSKKDKWLYLKEEFEETFSDMLS